MELKRVVKRSKPLFYKDDGIVYSSADKIVFENKGIRELVFSFEMGFFEKILSHFSLYYRALRSGVYSAINANDISYFSYNKQLFQYSWQNKSLTKEFKFRKGNGPLQYADIKGVEGFSDSICFGEYFGNPNKEPVYIYQKKQGEEWQKAYCFGDNELNHIHALIPDEHNRCVWILAGDFGQSASIWRASDNFSCVEEIVAGDQKFRACVAFPVKQGLLYATDTQLSENSICLLHQENGEWKTTSLMSINGSAIYGCELKDYYVFSTATEPGDEVKGKLSALLERKPGPGIKKNQSDVILCEKGSLTCRVLYSREKDIYPYRLFQFGAIMFPNGGEFSNKLLAYNVGSKKNDLSTEEWS